MLISMARYVLETGWRVVMNFFFVIGVVWSVGSLAKKVQSFDCLVPSIPIVTRRPMSLFFSLSFIRRPLIDIAVFCITFILFFSFKLRHRPRRAPRQQSQKAGKEFDSGPKLQPLPPLTYHHSQETSESYPSPEPLPSEKKPATQPPCSVELIIPRAGVEGSPPPETRKLEDPPTSSYPPVETSLPTGQFRRSPDGNKPADPTEAPDRGSESSPLANKSPRRLRRAAAAVSTLPPPAPRAPQPRRFPDGQRQSPTKSDASRPRLNGARGAAAWTLERQPALVPSTLKPLPHCRDRQVFLLDEEQAGFFAGAATTAGIPAASAPPWPGSAEEDDLADHDSMDETWRAITRSRALHKSETWNTTRGQEPESCSADGRMKKWVTFNESSSSRALPQRDRSMGAEELQTAADEFIAKMWNDLRLQRQESDQRYREMINRSTL